MKLRRRHSWWLLLVLPFLVAGLTLWQPSLILEGKIFSPFARAWSRELQRQARIFGRAAEAKEPAARNPSPYRQTWGRTVAAKIAIIPKSGATPVPAARSSSGHRDTFQRTARIEEASDVDTSSDPRWWVNSGAAMAIGNGQAETVQKKLSLLNAWRLDYALSNPEDTDQGRRPQNIFRLVERGTWENYIQELYVRIDRLNKSRSPNRNASNGVLLLNRYQDGQTLYYTGLRVDGAAVIKKKYHGTYYTMDYRPTFAGSYDRDKHPNLLPTGTWLGLRSVVQTLGDGTVKIQLYTDIGRTGHWTLAAEAIDDGISFGGPAISQAGHAGVRTDFMDMSFDDYAITPLTSL